MPYKDKQRVRQYQKNWVRQKRQPNESVEPGSEGVTSEGVTDIETVPASHVEGLNGKTYQSLPERPRYLELSDGQVLDRANQPEPGFCHVMRACNESAYNYHPLKGKLTDELRERLT